MTIPQLEAVIAQLAMHNVFTRQVHAPWPQALALAIASPMLPSPPPQPLFELKSRLR